MEEELNPCPFCGSENLRIPKEFGVSNDGIVISVPCYVSCLECGSDGPKIAYVKCVIKQWNERKCTATKQTTDLKP